MLTILSLIALAAAFVGVLILLVFSRRSFEQIRSELTQMTIRVNSHLDQTAQLNQKMGEGTVKAIGDLYMRLGSVEASSQKVFELGKEIVKLQEILRAPKIRGGFGELLLGDLLGQMIPRDHFSLQHQFPNGSRVDAVIFVGDYLVPIDAKFPLENFDRLRQAAAEEERKRVQKDFIRDIKKHVMDISERYILPDRGTLDFALMYIPSESIYYEVIASRSDQDGFNLSDFALKHHVIPVSPNSFYAYLQVILMGLRGLRLDQAAREIAESLVKLRSDFDRIGTDYATLGTHLHHLQGSYERVQRSLDRFGGKLEGVDHLDTETGKEKSIEAVSTMEKLNNA